jgi:hypothetical protein
MKATILKKLKKSIDLKPQNSLPTSWGEGIAARRWGEVERFK